ncbi:CYTH domain-containing protein [Paraliobacillus quinghaiensis]|uniref:CYTH domain-containing protein n=1 Tax=Paraliobacillus quinghaiensis TaxID=470815 RepID=A0A917WSF9_9BACI|nr:CYTH domain-containing protein [Paraliobacillus quinghaiensis]GGM24753.1 CYTH domain-containing protein [Paraliobacillus quinghaiensis]
MAQEIEMESKNLLTETEYNKLFNYLELTPNQIKQQTNYYFETPDFQLKAHGAALRIRVKDGQWQLTLKEPYQNGLLETHDHLTADEAEKWLSNQLIPKPHVKKQLNNMGITFESLNYGGALKTDRIETPYKQALVVIDYSVYNNTFDYELEVESETKEKSEAVLLELIEQLNISKKPTKNKIERFYETL